MKATINDVARHAGVSKATVSRVLNGYQNVAAPLRERVKLSIEALEYRPSAVARDLSIGQTKLLGVLVDDITTERNAQIVRGIEDRASENGYLVLLRNTDGSAERTEESVLRLTGQNVAGIISIASVRSEPTGATLPVAGIAFVRCDDGGLNRDETIDAVGADEASMAHHAVYYLMALGHRAIAFLACEGYNRSENGYRDTMETNGLKPLIYPAGDNCETVQAAIMKAMRQEERPTAFVCADGHCARATVDTLYHNGFSIPGDVSVVQLSDVTRGDTQRFLTTVRLPAYEMGLEAVSMLLERIAGTRKKPKQRLLPTALKTRRSCASAQLGTTLQISPGDAIVAETAPDPFAKQFG